MNKSSTVEKSALRRPETRERGVTGVSPQSYSRPKQVLVPSINDCFFFVDERDRTYFQGWGFCPACSMTAVVHSSIC